VTAKTELPKPCRHRFQVRTMDTIQTGQLTTVEGWMVEVDGIEFGLDRLENRPPEARDRKDGWKVTELQTGMSIGFAAFTSRADAIQGAIDWIDLCGGPGRVRDIIWTELTRQARGGVAR